MNATTATVSAAASAAQSLIPVGIDDGFANTKLALPDGRLLSIPSAARIGDAKVSVMPGARRQIFEYQTDQRVFSAGDVEATSTEFDDYSSSDLNRVIVQHALQCANLEGCELHVVSGLPVSTFYRSDGARRDRVINDKQQSLLNPVTPRSAASAASIRAHEVLPEALAAWYDYVITETQGRGDLHAGRVQKPVAIIDIGGRTTDIVVVRKQAVLHQSSGSAQLGMLKVSRMLREQLERRFDAETFDSGLLAEAVSSGLWRQFGRDHDVTAELTQAKNALAHEIRAEAQRQLGRGAELDAILVVGGGAIALSASLKDWFPNQRSLPAPEFANARGMLKFLRFVHLADSASN